MNSKNPLAKYLLGGAAVGAMAISPFLAPSVAQAQEMTTTTTTTVSAEPTLVTGTVDKYWLDRSGYVSAMSVKTGTGTEIIRFSPSQARRLYTSNPTGSAVNVWVTPGEGARKYWNARGLGDARPSVWYPVNTTSGFDWLAATPYTTADAQEVSVAGKLKGVVVDDRGDVLALAIKNDEGQTLVRVPAELRHVARGHIGSARVSPLFQGADVEVKGVREAPRWGVLTPFSGRVAASTIAINGKHAGSIGIQTLPMEQRNALLGWNIGGDATTAMLDAQARELGYGVYSPEGEPMGENMASVSTRPASTMTTTTTTTTTTERATGRVMIVTADGQLLPVVRQSNRIWVTGTDGKNVELRKVNGKYAVPESMTGARMQMVMSDGRRMEMDTVDGQLMVIMADGSTAPVTLHTP